MLWTPTHATFARQGFGYVRPSHPHTGMWTPVQTPLVSTHMTGGSRPPQPSAQQVGGPHTEQSGPASPETLPSLGSPASSGSSPASPLAPASTAPLSPATPPSSSSASASAGPMSAGPASGAPGPTSVRRTSPSDLLHANASR